MSGAGDSQIGTQRAADKAARALIALATRRGGIDHPGSYEHTANPWTDQLAKLLRDDLIADLAQDPQPERQHAIAARWRFPALLPEGPVLAAAQPVYDLAWRVYPADCSRLIDQPLIAECIWRGGWSKAAPACDRLAQGRASVRVLCVQSDPSTSVGDMTLAEACAYRISAFAPPGDTVLLAFYGGTDSWREVPGFTLIDYVTGRGDLKVRSA